MEKSDAGNSEQRRLHWPEKPRARLGLFALAMLIPFVIMLPLLGIVVIPGSIFFPTGLAGPIFDAIYFLRPEIPRGSLIGPDMAAATIAVIWVFYAGFVIFGIRARTERQLILRLVFFTIILLLNTAGCIYVEAMHPYSFY